MLENLEVIEFLCFCSSKSSMTRQLGNGDFVTHIISMHVYA